MVAPSEKQKATIKEFFVELVEKLPLEDQRFYATLYGADLCPIGTGGIIEKKETRADKVTYFLQ